MEYFHEYNVMPLFGHAMYSLTVISFLMRDVLYIRAFTLLGSCCAFVYYFFCFPSPVWVNLEWETALFLANLFHLSFLVYERQFVRLSAAEERLLDTTFKGLARWQFKKLIHTAHSREIEAGQQIVTRGEKVKELILVTDGTVHIINEGEVIAQCGPGSFLGEISFLSGELANASAATANKSSVLAWDQDHLRSFLMKNPSVAHVLSHIFNVDLSQKLLLMQKELSKHPKNS